MKLKNFILSGVAIVSFGSCAPVPSYSVDPYVGSLDQCLDIQGTYESQNHYENYSDRRVTIDTYLLPIQFGRALSNAVTTKKIILREIIEKGKKTSFKKAWFTFRVLNAQHLEITVFNIDGQSFTKIIDMQKKLPPSWLDENEEFACNRTSWQRAYSRVSYRESGSDKTRIYSKTTKLPDGTLRVEAKYDARGGALGLYTLDKGNVDRIGYFRKVDLTVDDIRAMNDKAKRAIAQYDQLATSPPPQ